MIAAPPFVDVTAPRPVPPKEILWPTGYEQNGAADSQQFPELKAIKARCTAIRAEPLSAFVQASRVAQDRILVLDDYLFKPRKDRSLQQRIDFILDWFPIDLAATDVRILTNEICDRRDVQYIEEQFSSLENKINSMQKRDKKLTIKVRFTLNSNFKYVHDRFAVVDNDLWHFGATVGGLHHLVNAATHGWNAAEHHAVQFFNLAWSGDPDVGRRHDKAKRRGGRRA